MPPKLVIDFRFALFWLDELHLQLQHLRESTFAQAIPTRQQPHDYESTCNNSNMESAGSHPSLSLPAVVHGVRRQPPQPEFARSRSWSAPTATPA